MNILREAHRLALAAGEEELAHEFAVRHDARVPAYDLPICDPGLTCKKR